MSKKYEYDKNVKEAKLSLKSHIKFFESLINHISYGDELLKSRAMWASWCLHRYINDRLIDDIEAAMKQYGTRQQEDKL